MIKLNIWISLHIEWTQIPIVKRIGFERVEIEWQQMTDFKISRINFEVNNMPSSDEYSNEKYKFINGKYSSREGQYDYNRNPNLK